MFKRDNNGDFNLIAGVLVVGVIIVAFVVIIAIEAALLMWAWNLVVKPCGRYVITYWQGVGVTILLNLFFGVIHRVSRRG